MGEIISVEDLSRLKKEKRLGKTVLAGGCFDILHRGHLEFLQKSKELGDTFIVMLESDENIKKLKGNDRPYNSQKKRSIVLSNLPYVDYVICLTELKNDNDYEILVKQIEPDIIAITRGNKVFDWEREYVKKTRIKIVEVMNRMEDYSTTKLLGK